MIGNLVERGLYRAFRLNPCVAANELRMRMRGVRPFLVLCLYASIAAGAVLIALAAMTWEEHMVLRPGGTDLGRSTFTVLIHTQLTLMLLILPAYGAGAITMEREKRTLEMLRAALLTPADIVSGKLLSVLAFGLVLLLTPLPVAAWCLLLGGISPGEIFLSYSYLLAVVVFASAWACGSRRRSGGLWAPWWPPTARSSRSGSVRPSYRPSSRGSRPARAGLVQPSSVPPSAP